MSFRGHLENKESENREEIIYNTFIARHCMMKNFM
jgi:hypothetical protein